MVSATFDAAAWKPVDVFDFDDITYHRHVELGAVRVALTVPRCATLSVRAPSTSCIERWTTPGSPRRGCRSADRQRPSPKDGGWAFCAGGDQRIRGRDGYRYASGDEADSIDPARSGRLHILEVQRLIRFMPKVVIALVGGWAAGGGHSLHVVCDLTIASREHARFKQTDVDVGSFDGGYGSAYLARQTGQKRAREIFFLGQSTTPSTPTR
jgi:naphthoate synthase